MGRLHSFWGVALLFDLQLRDINGNGRERAQDEDISHRVRLERPACFVGLGVLVGAKLMIDSKVVIAKVLESVKLS